MELLQDSQCQEELDGSFHVNSEPAAIPDITDPIPPLSSISKVTPSPLLLFNLVEILYVPAQCS